MAIYDLNGNVLTSDGGSTKLLKNLEKWKGKTLVTDGNSLVEHNNWGKYLAEYLGMNFVQCGNSGGELARGKMADIKANVRDNYPDKADLIILQGDSNVGSVEGDPSQQMDGENGMENANVQTNWPARINYLVRCLKAKYPNVVIVLMPDSVRYDSYRNGIQYSQNPPAPNILYELNRSSYVMMKKVAEYNRHLFWAFDGDTPFNPTNLTNYYAQKTSPDFVQNDGTHPNTTTFPQAKGAALAWWCGGITFDPNAPNDAVPDWESHVTATITNNLTNVSNSLKAVNWQYYMPYVADLVANSGNIKTVKITMGGTDVTNSVYKDGKITIKRVTGDVVITATA